jgi:PII-like signaling protein
MHIDGEALLLRIIIGESDRLNGKHFYESIIQEARKEGLAGATAWHGELGFGASSRIRTTKVLDLSTDLPVVIEIIDKEDKIRTFLSFVEEHLETVGCGGIITVEKIEVHRYFHKKDIFHNPPNNS